MTTSTLHTVSLNRATLLQQLVDRVGADRVLGDEESLQAYGRDWTRFQDPAPSAVVLPGCVEEVQAVVRWAGENGVALVPSGGRTGLSGGAVAANAEVVVAMDRMNRIRDFDPVDRQVVCEAGVVTEQLQQFAADRELFYPVDFASSGSSQIGGNIATNAGGIKVIRYGMTRDWVMGLKVVTGTGELLDLNRGLIKNATGYDLRHLFIGSEGTLGLIVEATMALARPPEDPTVLVLATANMDAVMEVLKAFRATMEVTAFEFFSEEAMQHVIAEKGLQRPFDTAGAYYALIEFENTGESVLEAAMSVFESCMENGHVLDGTMSQSAGQAQNLWRLREDISETIARFTPYKNDISVRIARVPQFLADVEAVVNSRYPDFEIIWFGHIGDGNVHLNILKPEALSREEFFRQCNEVSSEVFDIVRAYGGSISAEHGVGLLKKPYLQYSRDEAEIEAMRSIKRVFDPKGILNPGKIFD